VPCEVHNEVTLGILVLNETEVENKTLTLRYQLQEIDYSS